MERERIEAIRAMVDLQAKRHSELGGPESSYQVAIDPSELAYLLDSTRARRVGEAVIEAGETGRWMVEWAIDSMRNGVGFDEDDMPKLMAIRDALRGEP